MSDSWEVLLVDDEPDIHQVTKLALKRKRWRKRRFNLTSAYSREQAEKIIVERKGHPFHVGLIDVVMETTEAGLDLCRFIRDTCPHSFRIVLRTGQPGVAPEEFVLNEYDIDYYLSKVEATPERLYAIMRACLRSSEDISTLLAYGSQLQNFTKALCSVSAMNDLLVFMREGLRFLELKHGVDCIFFSDLSRVDDPSTIIFDENIGNDRIEHDRGAISAALQQAVKHRSIEFQLFRGENYGLAAHSFVIPFHVSEKQADDAGQDAILAGDEGVDGGLFIQFTQTNPSDKDSHDFFTDARLFVDNWRIAHATLRLQERLSRETMLREKMYYERMQSIARMVAGVAHEMNTPIGVANTAAAMISEIVGTLINDPPSDEAERGEMVEDLLSTSALLSKNLERSKELVSSFKQLSASQLSDHKTITDIRSIISDCVTTMGPEARKHGLTIDCDLPQQPCEWDGYPSYLTQVIVNLIHNALRHAYPEGNGRVAIQLQEHTYRTAPGYLIRFEDFGVGVLPEILPRIFEPFVTSARGRGGTGLGLSISHNIVANMLQGRIAASSKRGEGTTFQIELPKVVPVHIDPAIAEMRRLQGICGD